MRSIITLDPDCEIGIDFTAGRGENGLTAALDIQAKMKPAVSDNAQAFAKELPKATAKPKADPKPEPEETSEPEPEVAEAEPEEVEEEATPEPEAVDEPAEEPEEAPEEKAPAPRSIFAKKSA